MNDLAEKLSEPPKAEKAKLVELDRLWVLFADRFYPALVRGLTGVAIVVMCLWMSAGIVHLAFQLTQGVRAAWTQAGEQAIVDALILLALLEVVRTLQSYLKLGRVRVTFILDTALVVLISELMGLWFREDAPGKVLLGLGVIITLVALRIMTAKFPPEPHVDQP